MRHRNWKSINSCEHSQVLICVCPPLSCQLGCTWHIEHMRHKGRNWKSINSWNSTRILIPCWRRVAPDRHWHRSPTITTAINIDLQQCALITINYPTPNVGEGVMVSVLLLSKLMSHIIRMLKMPSFWHDARKPLDGHIPTVFYTSITLAKQKVPCR